MSNSTACRLMNKYGNHKTTVDGITFDSKKEAERYLQLKAMLNAGEISDLRLQVRIKLLDAFESNGHKYKPLYYIADFVYLKDGKFVVEDVKGYRTDVYKLKRKLFAYKYRDEGIEITEI